MKKARLAQIVNTICFRLATEPDMLITHNIELDGITELLNDVGYCDVVAEGNVDNDLLGKMLAFLDTIEVQLTEVLETENPNKIIPVYLSLGNYCVSPHHYESIVKDTANTILHSNITLQIVKDYVDELENEYVGVRP